MNKEREIVIVVNKKPIPGTRGTEEVLVVKIKHPGGNGEYSHGHDYSGTTKTGGHGHDWEGYEDEEDDPHTR